MTPPPATSEFDIIQQQVFDVNCLSGGCHNSQSRAGDMNLTAGGSYDELVGHVPDNPTARENGFLRVEPFVAENSFILRKLRGPGPGEGSRMPRDRAPLAESDIQRIEDWILNGAPPGTITPGAAVVEPTPTGTRAAAG